MINPKQSNIKNKSFKIVKEKPLAEIVLRKYEKPFQMEQRELVKKLCLSIGLLNPGDSRDVIVDLLQVILNSNKALSVKEIAGLTRQNRKKYKLSSKGCAESNIHRQVRRLKELSFVVKEGTAYRVNNEEKLLVVFEERIEKQQLRAIVERVKEYLKAVQEEGKMI